MAEKQSRTIAELKADRLDGLEAAKAETGKALAEANGIYNDLMAQRKALDKDIADATRILSITLKEDMLADKAWREATGKPQSGVLTPAAPKKPTVIPSHRRVRAVRAALPKSNQGL